MISVLKALAAIKAAEQPTGVLRTKQLPVEVRDYVNRNILFPSWREEPTFEVLDADKDGLMTTDELVEFLRNDRSEFVNYWEAEQFVWFVDMDGDFALNKAEYESAVEQVRKNGPASLRYGSEDEIF